MMRVLFLDCFSGISGDMTVGALCDLGVKPSTLEWELSKIDLGDFHMHFERQQRQAIEGIKFDIHEGATHTHGQDAHEGDCGHGHEEHSHAHCHEHGHEHTHSHEHKHGEDCCGGHGHGHEHSHGEHSHSHCHEHGHEHTHSHEHKHGEDCCGGHGHGHEHSHEEHSHTHAHSHCHEHGHSHSHEHEHGEHCCSGDHHEHGHVHGRTFSQIRALIEESDLSDFVKKHALSIFHRIAVAEGRIHGKPPEEVGFHEVGALDSIADIICTCVGIEELGVDAVYVSPIQDGRGWVKCAHGLYPIPAIATLEILKGIPVGQIDEPFEMITPTGAAILAEFGTSFGMMPRLQVEKIGYGIGTRVHPTRPNVLRAVLGTLEGEKGRSYQTDTITRLQTNVDDQSPELTGAAVEKLFEAGALDVYLTPIQMKKNRPGVEMTVLCETSDATKMADLLFRETSSFGMRVEPVQRWKLDRRFEVVQTAYGEISVKLGLAGEEILHVSPEFESCRKASEAHGVALRQVYEAAIEAWKK